jgi:hypothetical protein
MRQSISQAVIRCLAVAGVLMTSAMLSSCSDAGTKMRAKIAGTYIRDVAQTAGGMRVHEYETLTLTPAGRWKVGGFVQFGGRRHDHPGDSGSYRITDEVTLSLHSEVEPAMPFKYTISGDTLISANAGFLFALTGHDIGEKFLVRAQ